jgi:putative transposase
MGNGTYWTGAHTKHRLKVHLVWIPKYRKRILLGKVAIRLKKLFYEACTMNRWYIHEMAIVEDHVHILIQIKTNESVAHVVHILKGGSSRIIRKEFPELYEFLWGDSFWADGYFAETVGQLNEATIRSYIKAQRSSVPQSA